MAFFTWFGKRKSVRRTPFSSRIRRGPLQFEQLEDRILLNNDLYQVPGPANALTQVIFEETGTSTNKKNEVAVYVVDDSAGRVGNLLPGSSGYAKAALQRGQVLYVSGRPEAAATAAMSFPAGSFLAFYVVQNDTTQSWLQKNAQNKAGPVAIFSVSDANLRRVDQVQSTTPASGAKKFVWADSNGSLLARDGNWNLAPRAIQVPGEPGYSVPTSFKWTFREAGFNNELGIHVVDGPDGRVGNFLPGDAGYAGAALAQAQVVFASGQTVGATKTISLPSGAYFAFYIIQNSSTAKLKSRNPDNSPLGSPLAFFSFPQANPDQFDHVRFFTAQVIAFEDLTGGGDRDFDDLVASFSFGAPKDVSPPVLTVGLANDTAPGGGANTDLLTFDPTLRGTVQDNSNRLKLFQASLDGGTFQDALPTVGSDGQFSFDVAFLKKLNRNLVLRQGSHTVRLKATDPTGNTVNLAFTFTLDSISPATTARLIRDTAPGDATNTDKVTSDSRITGTLTDVGGIFSFLAGFDNSPATQNVLSALSGANFSFDQTRINTIFGGPLPDGRHTLHLLATDQAGNVSSPVDFQFTLDTTTPEITAQLANDTAPDGTNTDTVTSDPSINGTVVDAGTVATFVAGFDNKPINQDVLTTLSNGIFSFDKTRINTIFGGQLPDGEHTLHLQATDQAGNVSLLYDFHFTLDTKKPAVTGTLTNDTAPEGTNTDTITSNPSISGKVTDAGTIAVFRAGFDSQPISHDILSALSSGDFSFTASAINTIFGGPLPDGEHTLHLLATDQAGNVSAQFDIHFTLDTSVTASLDLDPASDTGDVGDFQTDLTPVIFTGQTEPGTEVTLVGVGATQADNSGHYEFPNVELSLGVNSFTLRATDVAGNQTSFERIVTRGELPPGTTVLREGDPFVVQANVPVELGQTEGTRTLHFSLNAVFDRTDNIPATEDVFLVYLVDPDNPGHTLLDRGEQGTSLFSLTGDTAEFPPGLVRYDGSAVDIDVTSLGTKTNGLLVFQLLNSDTDNGTVIYVGPVSSTVAPEGEDPLTFPLETRRDSAGPALDLIGLTESTTVELQVGNIHFDSTTGKYTADMNLHNLGPAIGRHVAVVFPGLPPGVQLVNPSGVDGTGAPYINFHEAVPSGGMESGAFSSSIQVNFDNPALTRFQLLPKILVGGANQAPLFAAIGPLSVQVGGYLQIQISANDPDGDPVQFTLVNTGPMPTGRLEADGTLIFNPAAGEQGTYQFTLRASDGVLTSSQVVSLEVTNDPVTSTRISGFILDTNGAPLANVPVELAGFQVQTGPDGSFTITLPILVVPTESFPITIPQGDPQFDPFNTGTQTIPFRRARFDVTTGTSVNNPREQPTFVSSFIDASMVYGSDPARAAALRANDGTGRLKTSAGNLMPFNNPATFPDGTLENDNASLLDPNSLFAAGDIRANENVPLIALHTLFVREHNRLADAIKAAHPTFDDETIYQQARRLLSAEIQHITYNEFLPLLLGSNTVPTYTGYHADVDPRISALFSTAAFRFGHSQLISEIKRLDAAGASLPGGSLTLQGAFFTPAPINNDGIEPYLRGLVASQAQNIDAHVIDDVRNFLFGPPGSGGMDLPALNIQRGREMGLPSYNQARIDFGLTPVSNFSQITSDPAVRTALQGIYGSVDDIDVWVGGIAEDHAPGALLGPLFQAIIADQFQRSRDGDRFWFENAQFSPADLAVIRSTTLAGLIERNTTITGLPASVFTTGTIPAGPAPAGTASDTPGAEFRTFDGTGNNLLEPTLGSAGTNLLANFTREYGDGISTPGGADRPNPRAISNAVVAQSSSISNTVGVTAFAIFWGQILDHDLSLTPGGVSDTLKIHGEQAAGNYPFIAEKLPLLLGRTVIPGVNNVIARPIYLPALDIENAVQIDPSANTIVTTPNIPGASLLVAANTLKNRAGTSFTGKLSITEVPADFTPAALPDNLFPDLVVTIQPGEMVFTQPAPITLPNRGGYAPGVLMDLWSINPITGNFDNVGQGKVSADGSVIETVSGGIRNSSWHFFALFANNLQAEVDDHGCICCPVSAPANSEVNLHTGGITETHSLATYQSLGENRGVTLVYDSTRADIRPIVHFITTVAGQISTNVNPDQVIGQALVGNLGAFTGDFQLATAKGIWSIPEGPNVIGQIISGGLQLDLNDRPSGQYSYDLAAGILVFLKNGGRVGTTTTVKGEFTVINQARSPFGSGWGIAGLQELFINQNGSILLVDGGGTSLHFEPSGGSVYVSPEGDFSRLEKLSDGGFRRTLKDQTVYTFDTNLKLVSVRDRNNNTTRYEYAGGLLTKIVDPVGLETRFVYENGRVASIVDPANRTTFLIHDAAGNLNQILDPDNALQTWNYDSRHHLTGTIDARGNISEDVYDASGRLVRSTLADGQTILVSPVMTQGLDTSGKNTTFASAIPVSQSAQGRTAMYVDANGSVKAVALDEMGQASSSRDAVGSLGGVQRNDDNLVVSQFNGRGNSTKYTYDANGNVTSITDEISDTTPQPTIFWVSLTDGNWNDPNNWNTGVVPGPNDDVLIDVPHRSFTVTNTGSVKVKSLQCANSLVLVSGSSLTLGGESIISGSFTIRDSGTLIADGNSASVFVTGSAVLTGANLTAKNGGRLSFLEVSVSGGPGATLSSREFRADGAGSVIDLSQLTTMSGRSGIGATFTISAVNSGQVDLSALQSVTQANQSTVSFASNSNGRIKTPLLTSIVGATLTLRPTGAMDTAQIATLVNSAINVDGLRTFDFSSVTNLTSTSVTLRNGGNVLLPNAFKIDGCQFDISGGITLALPAATSYAGLSGTGLDFRLFKADGANTVLDVSHITTLSGRGGITNGLQISAVNGGRVDLSGLQSITQAANDVLTSITANANSRINTPVLTSIKGTTLNLKTTGVIDTAQITSLTNSKITFDGLSSNPTPVDFGSVTNLNSTIVTLLNTGNVLLPNASNIDGAQFDISGGITLALPSATRYAGLSGTGLDFRLFKADGANTVLDVSNITTLSGRGGITNGFQISAVNGGRVDLSGLQSITQAANDVLTSITANANSRINTPVLTSVKGTTLNLKTTGVMDTAQITSLTNSKITFDGLSSNPTPVDFGSVTNLNSTIVTLLNTGNVLLPNASNIDGAQFDISGGITLALPSATSYAGLSGTGLDFRLFKADGANTVLDVSRITALSGRGGITNGLQISAVNGGRVDLSGLQSITQAANDVITSITANANSRINTPVLTSIKGTTLNLKTTGVMDTAQITTLTNSTLAVDNQTVNLSGLTTVSTTTFTLTNGTISASTFSVPGNSFLTGKGTISANLANSGQLTPGGSAASGIAISGDFTQTSTGKYTANIGGLVANTGFDQLQITGAASLAGTLAVSVISSFKPVVGDRFPILTFASKSGSFSTVTGLTTADGVQFVLDETAVDLALLVTASPYTRLAGILAFADTEAPLALEAMHLSDEPENPSPLEGAEDIEDAPLFAATVDELVLALTTPPLNQRTFTYDPVFNQLTSMTDELGHQTLYELDPANGNVLTMTRVVGAIGGGDDLLTHYTYTLHGLVDTITDPLLRITDYDYDSLGRVTMVISAKGTVDQAVMQYEYVAGDFTGNVFAVIDPNGNRTEYEYDAMNRVKKITEADPDGVGGPLTSPIMVYTYDEAGNLKTSEDARHNVTTYEYDGMNRLTRTTLPDPDGSGPLASPAIQNRYDKFGNLVATVDPLDHVTEHRYDARNRRIETIDPDKGSTKFGYDLNNNLIFIIDSVSNRTEFQYDARNRPVQEKDPLGKVITYGYDKVDNLVLKTDRTNRQTVYEYDDLNRLTTETWVAAAPANAIHYVYDKASNLTSVTDVFSSLAYTYDKLDRVKTVDNLGTPGAPRVVLAYGYDPAGNVLSVTDTINGQPGAVTAYDHDALNRLKTLTQTGPGLADKRGDFGYNSLGQFETINRYANLAGTQLVVGSTYQYDGLNRLTSLTHANSTATVAFYNYTFDVASRITSIADVDGATTYGYDNRDELTGADHTSPANPDENYQYDANGNRIQSSLHGNGYQTGPGNRLKSDGTYNYAYDEEGNMLKRTSIADGSTRDFAWDHRNRLTSVTDKSAGGVITNEVTFAYDALNRRLAKTANGISTLFVYDREDVILDFLDTDATGPATPTLKERYLHGPDIDQVLAQDNGAGSVQWMLTDHLGTVRDLVNNSGVVVNHIIYDSFGNVVSQTSASVHTRFLFTGREFDQETELYGFRARYFSQSLGVFISEDVIRWQSGRFNLFEYAKNQVTSFRDPFGLQPTYFSSVPPPMVPPVRHPDVPWGYPPVTKRERDQIYQFCLDKCDYATALALFYLLKKFPKCDDGVFRVLGIVYLQKRICEASCFIGVYVQFE